MNELAKNFGAGVQELVDNASRLGLTWDLRPATVSTTDPLKVVVDGDLDTSTINAQSMVGFLEPGTRVFLMLIPPSGAFVVGYLDPEFTQRLQPPVNYSAVGASGSTSSATYVNLPNLPFVTVVKRFGSGVTNISLIMTQSLFSSAVTTGVGFGINLTGGTGTDVDLSTGFFNPANTHQSFAMAKLLTGLAPGTYTLSGRWKRYTGAGVLNTNGDDWTTILAEEVWAV